MVQPNSGEIHSPQKQADHAKRVSFPFSLALHTGKTNFQFQSSEFIARTNHKVKSDHFKVSYEWFVRVFVSKSDE